MITLEEAKNLKYGDYVHHVSETNSDGTPLRAKVQGEPKTWETRPEQVSLTVKKGLKNYIYISENSLEQWNLGYGP